MLPKNSNDLVSQWQAHAPVFAALGDVTRLALVAKLSGGPPRSIAQLTEAQVGFAESEESRLTRQAITKHLRVLERAKIVRCVRRGRESLFEFDPKPMEELHTYLELVSKQWDQALDRLKAFVEE
ncbi:MAG: regulatory protein ArsR [Acidobacteriaceae bacterium]|nr:regulatory protein ArsR [Acidobacteriaceae bacterium]